MAKIATIVILFFPLLYSSSYCQRPTVSGHSSVNDTVYLNKVVKLLETHYAKGEFDSVSYYLNKVKIHDEKSKSSKINAKLFFYFGLYHRAHTKNITKAIQTFNKSLFYANKSEQNELIERINYAKLSIYSGMLDNNNDSKLQKKLINQFYENISFSKKSKSDKHLFKSFHLINGIYNNYNKDSVFFTQFGNDFLSKFQYTSIGEKDAFCFQYFVSNKDFKKAEQHLDTIVYLYSQKKIDELLYSYILNSMMSMALEQLPLATKIESLLKTRVDLLPAYIDKIIYYNNFTKLYLNKNQIKKARYYQNLAKAVILRVNRVPLSMQLNYLTNEQILLKKEGKEYESLKLYEKIIPIKTRVEQLFSVFNLAILQEQANNNYNLQKSQYEIDLKKQEAKLLSEKNQKESTFLLLAIFVLVIIISIIGFQVIKISKQKKELQQLSNNQNTIFTVIGHDLRSPVVSIYTALLSTLNKATISDEATRTTLRKKTALLSSFILTLDNLLSWANSQQSSFKIKPTQVDINDVIEEVIELEATNIELAEVLILNHITADTYCFVDENHLKIILRNLIQNAVKFTPQNGTIQIAATYNDTRVEIIIQDSGLGFNTTSNSSKKGSGLGLLLVQKLVTINNGIFIKSDTETGALVTLLLPIA